MPLATGYAAIIWLRQEYLLYGHLPTISLMIKAR